MQLDVGDIAIDYSSARPSPPAIVVAGVKLVCRYISPNRSNRKNLDKPERDGLHAAGLSIRLVFENAQLDPLKGAPLGRSQGDLALGFCTYLGYHPLDELVVAVDFDVQPAQLRPVLEYLAAFKEATGWPQGVYGKDLVVTAAHDAGLSTFGWQTVAWSGGRRSPHAHVLQHARPVHPAVPLLGAVDDNTVLAPFIVHWSTTPDTPRPQQEAFDMLRLLVPTDDPAQFFAMCTPQGAALRCEWTGDLNRIEFYRNAHPAGDVPFEMSLTKAALVNVSLDGPLPPGWEAEQFGNPDEIHQRTANGRAVSGTFTGIVG